jgi:hypothetical protein
MEEQRVAPKKINKLPQSLTSVTRFSKILALILFIIFPLIGFYLGIKYQQKLTVKIPTASEVKNFFKPTDVLSPTITESYCAKAGEKPISNFNLTTGKKDPNIKIKNCCPGLKQINGKQDEVRRNPDICSSKQGVLDITCGPCGNGICDLQYEDYCNCPVDCK